AMGAVQGCPSAPPHKRIELRVSRAVASRHPGCTLARQPGGPMYSSDEFTTDLDDTQVDTVFHVPERADAIRSCATLRRLSSRKRAADDRANYTIGRPLSGAISGGGAHSGIDADRLDRFLRCAETVARLRHPHIARAFDICYSAGGDCYVVMEKLEGESL